MGEDMEFREITLEDARWAKPLLEANGYLSCEFAFVNIFIWRLIAHTEIARFEDYCILRGDYGGKHIHYQFPAGTGDLKRAVDAVLEYAKNDDKALQIVHVPPRGKKEMEALYPGVFSWRAPDAASDYLYNAADLAALPGRKYQKKRNHCSRFERQYPDWQFHEITPDDLPKICEFSNTWVTLYGNDKDAGILQEHEVVVEACRNYEALGLVGGVVTVKGEIVAFSFGSVMGDEFITHVEKASYDVDGAYNIINREIAKCVVAMGLPYINRENDMGEEGLRRAKQSYYPVQLLEKYVAECSLCEGAGGYREQK